MSRDKFKTSAARCLKVLAIVMAVLLTILVVIGVVYLRFGLAGFSKILGLEKQQILAASSVETQEIEYIENTLGYDPGTADLSLLTEKKEAHLNLTGGGLAYLISGMTANDEMLDNLQIIVNEDDKMLLSVVGDVDLILEAFGQSRELIVSTVGEIPDKVPVYIEVQLGEDTEASVIDTLKVGAVGLPSSIVSSVNPYVDEGLAMLFDQVLGVELNDLYISDGEIVLNGAFPAQ